MSVCKRTRAAMLCCTKLHGVCDTVSMATCYAVTCRVDGLPAYLSNLRCPVVGLLLFCIPLSAPCTVASSNADLAMSSRYSS